MSKVKIIIIALGILVLFLFGFSLYSKKYGTLRPRDSTEISLYENNIPNSRPSNVTERENDRSIMGVTIPTIIPFFPHKTADSDRTAILIFAGGGYAHLIKNEQTQVAQALNNLGIVAFVVKYRLPDDSTMKDKSIGPLQDAQQAMLLVRENAKKWHINTHRIGVMGFSAGGHLASTEATHFNTIMIENKEAISIRPDFMVLLYPVITLTDPLTHTISRENLIGKNYSDEINFFSSEKNVCADTPPTFLAHAKNDLVVSFQNSVLFYEALKKNHVNAELHLLQTEGHGFALKGHWLDLCAEWMTRNRFL